MENINSFNDLATEVTHIANELISKLPRVRFDACGLDSRAGRGWIDVDHGLIIIDSSQSNRLDYYGGFEYVNEDAISFVGEYKLYDGDLDDRVHEAVARYAESLTEEESEE